MGSTNPLFAAFGIGFTVHRTDATAPQT